MNRLPIGTLAQPCNWVFVYDENFKAIDWLDGGCTCLVVGHDIPMTNTGSNLYVKVLSSGTGKMGYALSSALKATSK